MRTSGRSFLPTAAVTLALTLLTLLSLAVAIYAGEIHRAIVDGDGARVKELLKANPALATAPDEGDPYRSQPLHFAAIAGNVELARLLIEAGADVDCGDSDESTPLDNAAMHHHADMVAFLISKGADVNRRDRNGACPMSFAAAGGDSAIVGQLMQAGADLNFRDRNGYTLLHFATSPNLRGLFDLLLAQGRDPNVATDNGLTPLHQAAVRGSLPLVEALLAAGANHSPRDEHGQTPLISAAYRDRADVARRLIEAGADPNAKDDNGNTAILPAAWTGSQEVVRVLTEKGADVNVVTASGDTPVFSAVQHGTADILDLMLKAGGKVDARDPRFGATPLHLAAALGNKAMVEHLLAAGADVSALEDRGRTPLELAVNYGHRDVAELLLAGGASGSLAGIDAGTLGAQGSVLQGEAVVWYLNHSGYAVKTKNHLLVFDYFSQGADPAAPGLCNGHVNPKELAGENVMVFASHEHQDHFVPAIFDWRNDIPKITYVLGCRPDSAPKYEYVGPREVRTVKGVKITTIDSNDPGVGFWVEVDGLVIFHAGDHANRWLDFSGPYKEEIDYMAAAGKRPDIAIMPISGCGFGDPEAVKLGVLYALDTLKPKVFLPAHSGGAEYRYKDFVEACRDKAPGVQMLAPSARGDRFRYREGRVALASN
jgi:ankyrin repeat protein